MIDFFIYFAKDIPLLLVSIFATLYAHNLPCLKLKNRPALPLNTPLSARWNQGLRAFVLVFIVYAPLCYHTSINYEEFVINLTYCLTAAFITGVLLPINLQVPVAPDLILNKHMLGQHFQVHLKEHDAPLTRHVYKQLNVLLHELQQQGAETLTMTSPLFYHPSGALRSLSRLNTLASALGITMTHRKIAWYESTLNKASLFMTRHTTRRNAASLHQLGPHWHTITFHFKGKTPPIH